MYEDRATTNKLALYFFIGLLSMFYAEIFSGASVLWFIDPWSLLVTFPLYLSHTLFFLNIALRFKRFSFSSLYLLGILFGLYETWITKVAWSGYLGTGSEYITLGGFAIIEFLIVSFFWHPIMSFIAPILTFEILCIHAHPNERELSTFIFPSHLTLLRKSTSSKILIYLIILTSSGLLAFNSGLNIIIAGATCGGTIVIILATYQFLKKKNTNFSIYNYRLSKRGFSIVIGHLIFLYLFLGLTLRPNAWPEMIIIILTILIYFGIIFLLYLDLPLESRVGEDISSEGSIFSYNDIIRAYLGFLCLTIIFCLSSAIAFIFVFLTLFLYTFLAIIFLILTIVRIFKKRRYVLLNRPK